MRKILIGIVIGVAAGILDVIPMIFQKLTWDANLSALTMWIVIGFFISTTEIKINYILKGILISFLVLIPSAFIIGWHEPKTLIPIAIMTLILGSLSGSTIGKFNKK